MQEDIVQKIIDCAMTVHRVLGSGFGEINYQRALAIEMRLAGLTVERDKGMEISYRDQVIDIGRADFVVEDSVLVQLKVLSELEPILVGQAKNFLEIYGLRRGLLINFGSASLEFRRVCNEALETNFIQNLFG